MDIRVGSVPEVGRPGDRQTTPGSPLEARLLAVRPPRKRRGKSPSSEPERRQSAENRDPANGRVLVLLVPDGSVLPEGLEQGQFRVFLRFARR